MFKPCWLEVEVNEATLRFLAEHQGRYQAKIVTHKDQLYYAEAIRFVPHARRQEGKFDGWFEFVHSDGGAVDRIFWGMVSYLGIRFVNCPK